MVDHGPGPDQVNVPSGPTAVAAFRIIFFPSATASSVVFAELTLEEQHSDGRGLARLMHKCLFKSHPKSAKATHVLLFQIGVAPQSRRRTNLTGATVKSHEKSLPCERGLKVVVNSHWTLLPTGKLIIKSPCNYGEHLLNVRRTGDIQCPCSR